MMFEDSDDITDDGGVRTASVRLLPLSSFDTGLYEELRKDSVAVNGVIHITCVRRGLIAFWWSSIGDFHFGSDKAMSIWVM